MAKLSTIDRQPHIAVLWPSQTGCTWLRHGNHIFPYKLHIHRCMQLHGCSVHMHTIILRHMSSERTPSCLSEIVAILLHGVDNDILISVYSIPRYYSYCIKLKVSRANYALYMHPSRYANLPCETLTLSSKLPKGII